MPMSLGISGRILLVLLLICPAGADDDSYCPLTMGVINATSLTNIQKYKGCLTYDKLMDMRSADIKSKRETPWCPLGLSGEELFTVQACQPCDIPGYYCAAGQSLPCFFGSYCPNTSVMEKCPEGQLCLPMSVAPTMCPTFKECPEGAQNIYPGPLYYIPNALILISMCVLSCAIHWRSMKAQQQADKIAEETRGEFQLAKKSTFMQSMTEVDIQFQNVGLTLKSSGNKILEGVTGRFPPKSTVALMGPSGSGKTTFMSVLLGRADYGKSCGQIQINGQNAALADTPNLVGFVPQDDIVHADLTVYQNLYYSAKLRLPASVSKEDKDKHIDHVVGVLGMRHVQHNLVGSPEKRGISGGQKKRVNIGMELAAMPAVLFMDEPTSGLDASASGKIMEILVGLAENGMTIVCVIHQPRKDVFNSFSHLLLLGNGGQQVYCGRREFVEEYLTGQNFRLPAKENPADWIIDVVSDQSPHYLPNGDTDASFKAPEALFDMWKKQSPEQVLRWIRGDPDAALTPLKMREVPGRFMQAVTLGQRCFRQHDIKHFAQMLGLMYAIGAFVGYFQSVLMPMIAKGGAWYTYSMLDVYLSGGPFGGLLFPAGCTIIATYLFGPKRLLYNREFSSGVSATAYWVSHTLYYTFTWDLCVPAVFTLPLYGSMVVLQPLTRYMIVNIAAAWYYASIGMFFSVVIQNQMACFTLLFFLPIIESMIGHPSLPGMEVLSEYVGLRWLVVARLAGEVEYLPEPVQQIAAGGQTLNGGVAGTLLKSVLKLPLHSWEMSTNYSEEWSNAIKRVFLLGLGFRLLVLAALLLSKFDVRSKFRQLLGRCKLRDASQDGEDSYTLLP